MNAAPSVVPTAPASETRLRVTVSTTDPELIARATVGDAAAFGELARRHQPYVRGFALRLLHDSAEAEDVTQETFARVFANMSGFRVDLSFTTYVCTIARNLCSDRRAWLGRRRFVDIDDTDFETDADTPIVQFEQHEARAVLRAAIETLPPTTRQVVSMLLEGLSRADVAAALGMPVNTVHTHFREARIMLAPKRRTRS